MLQQIVYEVTQIACAYKLSLCVFFHISVAQSLVFADVAPVLFFFIK